MGCILGNELLIIDNYDSFTFNLVQRIGELDIESGTTREFRVIRNDEMTCEQVANLQPTHLLISPGPGTPADSGISQSLVQHFYGQIPILGVCLGHQAIGALFGMKIIQYAPPIHGKTSLIYHDNTGVFSGLSNPFEATRYHSLVVDRDSVGGEFLVNAWTDEGMCMGLQWRGDGAPLQGVQFHPESFLTNEGHHLLANFLTQGS